MDESQRIKLILETIGAEGVVKLRSQLDAAGLSGTKLASEITKVAAAIKTAKPDVYEFGDTFEVLETEITKTKAAATAAAAETAKLAAEEKRAAEETARLAAEEKRAADEMARLTAEAARLAAELKRDAQGIYDFSDAYELVESKFDQIVAIAPRVERAFDWTTVVSPRVRKLGSDFDFASIALSEVDKKSAGIAGGGARNLQTSILQASYAFEDLSSTSGDVGQKLNSVANNVVFAASQFGPYGIAIGIAVTAGIALFKNLDSISGWFETRNPFPAAADNIKGMERSLEEANAQLDKLTKKTSLSNTELVEFNRLTSETKRLEKELADQRDAEQLKKTISESQQSRSKEFAAAVNVSGGAQAFNEVKKGLVTKYGTFGTEGDAANAQAFWVRLMKGDQAALEDLYLMVLGGQTGGGSFSTAFTGGTGITPLRKTREQQTADEARAMGAKEDAEAPERARLQRLRDDAADQQAAAARFDEAARDRAARGGGVGVGGGGIGAGPGLGAGGGVPGGGFAFGPGIGAGGGGGGGGFGGFAPFPMVPLPLPPGNPAAARRRGIPGQTPLAARLARAKARNAAKKARDDARKFANQGRDATHIVPDRGGRLVADQGFAEPDLNRTDEGPSSILPRGFTGGRAQLAAPGPRPGQGIGPMDPAAAAVAQQQIIAGQQQALMGTQQAMQKVIQGQAAQRQNNRALDQNQQQMNRQLDQMGPTALNSGTR